MSGERTVACFSELEVVKASLVVQASLVGAGRSGGRGDSAGKRWEKVWGVLWKGGEGWCLSLWGRKQQWKVGAAPLASVLLSSIKKFATTSVADRDHVLRLQLVDHREWVLACASSSMLSKWSDTLQDRLTLHLHTNQTHHQTQRQTQRQSTQHCDTKHSVASGWLSENEEESVQPGEELQLSLVSCPQFSSLLGEYAVLVEGAQLQVLKVGGAQYWQWVWSDVLWYCLDRDRVGWDGEWQLKMKIRGSCSPGGCIFTWAGTSLKRFYSLLRESAPSAEVLGKDRGISVADETFTESQLQVWMEELFLVEVLGKDVRGQYWLSFGEDRLILLDHASKVMRWEWSLKDVLEFTLEVHTGQKKLTIKVGSRSPQEVYCLTGEHVDVAFVVLKELMRSLPQRVPEPAPAEYGEGVRLVVSPTARKGMETVYHLTLKVAPKECSHLVGKYEATVDHTSLHLVGVGADKRWSWCLEHIRRFSVRERDSRLVIETGRRACFGEGQFVFCGDQLRLLCVVLKELTRLLCVVTRVRHVLVQIRERIVLRLRTAAPHELIESFPVEVHSSGASPLPPVGQYTLRILSSEIQFVAGSGEVVLRLAEESLNQVAMDAEGETGVPQVILCGTSLGTCTVRCSEAAQLYAILQLVKEHHSPALTAGPASQPRTTLPPVLSAGPEADGCSIIHQVKNTLGQSVSREDCRLALEEASLKLLRLRDDVPVWAVELCHLQGVTMEGYTDGKGVLLVQTRQGSPHEGVQYLLLCQQPEQVFEAVLRYAEEQKGGGMVHKHEVEYGRDSPMEDSSRPAVGVDEEDDLQTDSETLVCCSTGWDDHTVSVGVSVDGVPWSMGSSGSVQDSLTAQRTEYSLTLSTSTVPPATLSLMESDPPACPAPSHLALPTVAATSSATSVLSEMSDEVFYSDTEHPPAPSSLNLALFRPPRTLMPSPSPPQSVDASVLVVDEGLGDGWGGPQLSSLLRSLVGVPEEQVDPPPEPPGSYKQAWEVQEARVAFGEDLPPRGVAPQHNQQVCVVTPSPPQQSASTNSSPELDAVEEEVYRLRVCDTATDCPGLCVTQMWSVDCDNSIGVDLQSVPYASEMLWVWFGEQESSPIQEEEEEEVPSFHLYWQEVPCPEAVVMCWAQIAVA